jgi:hypothetical protein
MTMDAQAVALFSGDLAWSGMTVSLVVVIALMKVAPRNGGKSRSVHREPNDRDQQLATMGLSTPQDAIAILLHRLVRRLPTITTLAEHIAPTKRTTTLPISKKKNATCTTLFTCVSRNGNRSVHLGYTKPIFLHKWPPLLKRPPL